MGRKKTLALVLTLALLWPGAGLAAKKAPQIKTILLTWLCAGEETPARKSPSEDADVVWTLKTDRLYQTDQHVDQYYLLTDEAGRTGYVNKGYVRILNAKDLTAGTMFKLPHVASGKPRLPVENVMSAAVIGETDGLLFLPEEQREEQLRPGQRVYVFTAYGNYAAVWDEGRLGYVPRSCVRLLTGAEADAWRDGLRTETGSVSASALLEQAFSMLEAGNPIAARYGKITGNPVTPLFAAGVPYFWGGQDQKIMLERWPDYTTRKQWQGTHDFYEKDSVYVFGLDCVGFVKTALERAGTPLAESLNDLGGKTHCQAGDHLFCSEKNPFPADWRQAAAALRAGDVLALHHPGRHAMICIGTLRDYGYTEEQLPGLADYLDYPLMIHSGENPLAYQRFDCLVTRSEDGRLNKALPSDGGVSLCVLGVPREDAAFTVTCHGRTYSGFDVEGACVTIMSFDNVKDYFVFRPAGEETVP
ncbi:MAG: hypothetical protein IJ231_08595 [Clostridia bacterium]|nr:hypothetical protein [Clostridia bacterium]